MRKVRKSRMMEMTKRHLENEVSAGMEFIDLDCCYCCYNLHGAYYDVAPSDICTDCIAFAVLVRADSVCSVGKCVRITTGETSSCCALSSAAAYWPLKIRCKQPLTETKYA